MEFRLTVPSSPNAAPQPANEGKKDKRRRELVERVEKLRKDGTERRDPIFHDQLTRLHEAHLGLLAHPAPTHPHFLLRLHELSVRRDALLVSAHEQARSAQETAKRLYDAEIERIAEESDLAQRGVKERLLEACDERSRKLREDKDSLEINFESLFDPQPRPHATRRHRLGSRDISSINGTNLLNAVAPAANGITLPVPPAVAATIEGENVNSPSNTLAPNGQFNEPFPHSLLPSSPLLAAFPLPNSNGTMTAFSPAQAQAALLSTLASLSTSVRPSKRRAFGAGPGLPGQAQQWTVVPGRYEFLNRSLQGIHSLKGDEIADDLERMRKKRKRGTAKKAADM